MPSNYDRGRRHENKAVQDLRKSGYAAERNAGSHGPWDVTAVNRLGVRLIQVKAEGAATPEDWHLLAAIPAPECVSLELWERVPGGWEIKVVNGPKQPTFTV